MEIRGRKGRIFKGSQNKFVYILTVAMAVYQLYFLTVGRIDPLIFRAGHLAFALALIFLVSPFSNKSKKDGFTVMDLIFAVLAFIVFFYLLNQKDVLVWRAGVRPNTLDIIMSVSLILLVMEGSRRYFGSVLPIVSIAFLTYGFFGKYIPGMFSAAPNTPQRIVSYLYSSMGIYGSAIATSATFVFLFVMYGSFLLTTGVGELFMDIAKALTGGVRGGPAKVSVVSSALFGSISGSATSNVVTTGAFTIPLMKSSGYQGHFAAAIETAASVGGLFLPPIMGAGGFLIAEILQIPYIEVAKAAVIPAVLYYIVLFCIVDFEAQKQNMKAIGKEGMPRILDVLRTRGYLLIPIFVLLYTLLIVKVSPIRAGLWSILSCVLTSWLKPETRMGVKEILDTLSDGCIKALNISAATACAGIIVGIVQMTGVGLTFSSLMLALGGTSVFLALITAMIVAVILGMGLPITATYITVAAVLAPALIRMGLEPIAVHLFLYFFAAVSGMTPPVCVTAFAAAGISGEDPMQVGFTSVKLGIIAYILPFMFVFGTPLIMIGTVSEIIIASITALVGSLSLAAAVHGYAIERLSIPDRLALLTAGLFLVKVGALTNYLGIAILTIVVLLKLKNRNRHKLDILEQKSR